jgi:molecular chaperone GrpE
LAAEPEHAHTPGNGVDGASSPDADPSQGSAGSASAAPHGADERSSADAGGGSGEAGTASDSGAEKIAELSAENDQLRSQLLRKQADFENARKRFVRDKEEAIKFANDSLIVELISILDDFERAMAAAESGRDFATLHSGIELIEKQLVGTLERKWGLIRYDSAGKPFDPERHEALATEQSSKHSEATVLEDYQKGYTLHGRVIRAARVRVATPAVATAGSTEGDAANPQDNAERTG